MAAGILSGDPLAEPIVDALRTAAGPHPGFRPAHAKGLFCVGTFAPAAEAAELTRAPHAARSSTPVTVRCPTRA